MEPFYPLHVYVCRTCWLVQLEQYVSAERHLHRIRVLLLFLRQLGAARTRLHGEDDRPFRLRQLEAHVVELASNDGYLLQWFVKAGVPALGIEPAANVAAAAEERGVPTLVRFFGRELADRARRRGAAADLLLGNNVLAQVPDLNDFVAGTKILLAPDGVLTMEFPHVLRLIDENQFDTIYHEHFSLLLGAHDPNDLQPPRPRAVRRRGDPDPRWLAAGLRPPRRGRHQAGHAGRGRASWTRRRRSGSPTSTRYTPLRRAGEETKRGILELLIELKRAGKRIAGYGAPGKGNTLLNYCGIRTDFLDFTVDRSPYKQGSLHCPAPTSRSSRPSEIRASDPTTSSSSPGT